MLFDAPSNLAAITGPEATRDRISFFTLSVVSTAVQAGAIMTLIPLFEGRLRNLLGGHAGWAGGAGVGH